MGGMYVTDTATGASPDEALKAMLDKLVGDDVPDEGEGYAGWLDPYRKPGYVQVWDKPVTDDAIDWMRGWTEQNSPEGVDSDDKWGPWLMFPLASGGWCFFGWVNT